MSKYSKTLFILTTFVFFAIVYTKNIFADLPHCPSSYHYECSSDSGCAGTCFNETRKLESTILGCDQWEYDSPLCKCKWENQWSICYYESGCLQENCGTEACTNLSGWSPCNNCYEWRF
jgi:hypothetical protein